MTISITRTALYLSNIYQIFGYKSGVDGIVRSLRHHRWPFDIWQEIVFSALAFNDNNQSTTNLQSGVLKAYADEIKEGSGNEAAGGLLTIYEACWMADYSVSFASDTALVQETVTVNVSDILSSADESYDGEEPYSVLNTGNPESIRLTSGS
jgi:hypothetical protein